MFATLVLVFFCSSVVWCGNTFLILKMVLPNTELVFPLLRHMICMLNLTTTSTTGNCLTSIFGKWNSSTKLLNEYNIVWISNYTKISLRTCALRLKIKCLLITQNRFNNASDSTYMFQNRASCFKYLNFCDLDYDGY